MKKITAIPLLLIASFTAAFFLPQSVSYANHQHKKIIVPVKDRPVFDKPARQDKTATKPTAPSDPAVKKTEQPDKNIGAKKEQHGSVPLLKIGIPSGNRTVIIEIDLESYLDGVVGGEMPPDWPLEALKAQAVAARTFSLYSKDQHKSEGYNLCATTHCQVFGGLKSTNDSVKKAVAATRGEIITYGGKPIYAAFHADSGGCTADCAEVWGNDVPYLKHVKDGEGSPQRHWQANFTDKEIEAKLKAAGKDVGSLKKITVDSRTASGRVKSITFSGTKKHVTLTGTQARQVLGLKSALFTVTYGKNIRIEGDGSGHGLGLSQWGAYRLAAKKTYREILNIYYTGIKIEKLY